MAENKHPQGEAYDAYCKATYVINELGHLKARLGHVTAEAEKAVAGANEAYTRTKELCDSIRALAIKYSGGLVSAELLALIGEGPKGARG